MQIPVTILTGYLGAGKTTLLNRILAEKHNQKVAVIVNEYGEVGIDNQLVINSDEEIIEMNNGCICCTVRGDLVKILRTLIMAKDNNHVHFDRVVIETTGLADPAPVAQTFLMDQDLTAQFMIDSIVTVVDGKHISRHLDEKDEAQEQIAFADIILLNKLDLLQKHERLELQQRINMINPTAKWLFAKHCAIAIDDILNVQSFNLDDKLRIHPQLLEDHHHHHNDHIKSIAFVEEQPLNLLKVDRWMSWLIQEKGEDLLRYKGILNIDGVEERVIFQGIHMLFAGRTDRKWRVEEPRVSKFVLIGKNLDEEMLTKQFKQCLA